LKNVARMKSVYQRRAAESPGSQKIRRFVSASRRPGVEKCFNAGHQVLHESKNGSRECVFFQSTIFNPTTILQSINLQSTNSPYSFGYPYLPFNVRRSHLHEEYARLFAEVRDAFSLSSLIHHGRGEWTSADGAMDDDLEPARRGGASHTFRFPLDAQRSFTWK
jgi:hypothetical protein